MEPTLETLVTWKGLAVAVWLALLFAAERLRPAAREPQVSSDGQTGGPVGGPAGVQAGVQAGGPAGGWWRVARNLALWLANVALSPLVVLPVSYWAAGHHLGWRPVWWSGAPGLLLDVVLLDFLIYWWHRANHVVPLLWRFHEIHHLDRFLDTTSALRFHFGEVLLSALARAVVIILLDVPIVSVLVFEALVLTAAIFHHSNLRLPEGFEQGLARIVITPSIHWVHHHARRADTDSNYGTIFSFWDPLFASRSAKRRELDMPIGVEACGERGFLPLLLRPFLTAAQRGEG